jgi:hypothetical protein
MSQVGEARRRPQPRYQQKLFGLILGHQQQQGALSSHGLKKVGCEFSAISLTKARATHRRQLNAKLSQLCLQVSKPLKALTVKGHCDNALQH